MTEFILKRSAGLALFLTIWASQAMPQTPTQLKGVGWKASTNFGPALATDGNYAYIAWVDSASSDVYFSTWTGYGWLDAQVVGGTKWTAESSATPAWSYDGINFYLFWKGKTGNDIWFSEYSDGNWSDQAKVQNLDGSGTAETDTAPAGFFEDGPVAVYWKGAGGNKVWWDMLEAGWEGQEIVSGPTTDVAPSVESDPNSTGSFVPIFVKSASTNDIYVWSAAKYQVSGSGWAAKTTQPPAAALDGNGNDIVFWTGQTGTSIWYSYNTATSLVFGGTPVWSTQATVSGAKTNAAPTVAEANGPTLPVSLLAWKNATDNTVWYLDITSLP